MSSPPDPTAHRSVGLAPQMLTMISSVGTVTCSHAPPSTDLSMVPAVPPAHAVPAPSSQMASREASWRPWRTTPHCVTPGESTVTPTVLVTVSVPTVALTRADPGETASSSPAALTVATPGASETHVAAYCGTGAPRLSRTSSTNWRRCPGCRKVVAGTIATLAGVTPIGGATGVVSLQASVVSRASARALQRNGGNFMR